MSNDATPEKPAAARPPENASASAADGHGHEAAPDANAVPLDVVPPEAVDEDREVSILTPPDTGVYDDFAAEWPDENLASAPAEKTGTNKPPQKSKIRKKSQRQPLLPPAVRAQLATVWGFAKKAFSGAGILLLLSLGYLVAEIEFNMSLLDIAGSVRSDPAKMEDLQVFGRSVSAGGCFLLVLGLFASSSFHVTAGRLRWLYYMVGLLALVPMMVIFWATIAGPGSFPITPSGKDILLSMAPALGVAYGSAIGRGRNVFVNVVSLFLIVWPAVFLGQKLLIEQALIERTTWEQRVNARYVLLLRSILENCTINLEELALCDAEDELDSVKSARIILGSMWMLSPEGIRADMEENKDKMVQSVASRGMWFSPRAQYDRYLEKVSEERTNIQQQMIDRYYMPYRKASEEYDRAMSQEEVEKESRKAVAEVEKEIDNGWKRYKAGVREYQQRISASGLGMIQRIAPYKERLREYCATRNCPPLLQGKERSIVADVASDAEREFAARSGGYTPDIQTRAEFVAAYPTQLKLREKVQEYITTKIPDAGLTLPVNWYYEPESFRQTVEVLIRQEIDRKWKKKAPAGMRPGLSIPEFFEAAGIPPLPSVDELVMSPDVFFKKMILPRYRQIVDNMLGDIEAEKQQYANGQPLAEKGKDYARAVYIPAVALIISLLVVLLTLLRWWNIMVRAGIAALMRRHLMPGYMRLPVQAVMMGVFVAAVVTVPRFMPNPYAGVTYEKYRDNAIAQSPAMARVLDWAIHTQPAVYRLGSPIREMLDRLHQKARPETAAAKPAAGAQQKPAATK